MADIIVPTTELEAVNQMLSAAGEAPVATLLVSGLAQVALAKSILNEVSRETQKRGWDWNTDEDVNMALDVNNEIPLATNMLRVRMMGDQGHIKVVIRNQKLLWKNPPARTGPTYSFANVGLSPVRCLVTYGLPFDQLPETARAFITIRATRKFTDRYLGSDTTHKFTQQDENSAFADLEAEEAEDSNFNILNSDGAMSIWRGAVYPTYRR
jgi:hypothetical protein